MPKNPLSSASLIKEIQVLLQRDQFVLAMALWTFAQQSNLVSIVNDKQITTAWVAALERHKAHYGADSLEADIILEILKMRNAHREAVEKIEVDYRSKKTEEMTSPSKLSMPHDEWRKLAHHRPASPVRSPSKKTTTKGPVQTLLERSDAYPVLQRFITSNLTLAMMLLGIAYHYSKSALTAENYRALNADVRHHLSLKKEELTKTLPASIQKTALYILAIQYEMESWKHLQPRVQSERIPLATRLFQSSAKRPSSPVRSPAKSIAKPPLHPGTRSVKDLAHFWHQASKDGVVPPMIVPRPLTGRLPR